MFLLLVGLVSLQTNTTLVGLDLSSNGIGVAGALALAETLRVNTSLKYVSMFQLSTVHMFIRSIMLLCIEWFRCGLACRSLGLYGNAIGDEGAEALAAALTVRGVPIQRVTLTNYQTLLFLK